MEHPIRFVIEKKLDGALGRAGRIQTPHGDILTPAFVVVGTKATIKSLTPEQVSDLNAQVVLANNYHLYLQPGFERIKKAGGLGKFMNWNKPTMTDSGGFQVFSLGVAYGKKVSKMASNIDTENIIQKDNDTISSESAGSLAKIDEDGVTFKSVIDGSSHRFSPERAIEIEHAIGADIIFAFDECTSPLSPYNYQVEAMDRTHRWAKRCLDFHNSSVNSNTQGLFGIVQGGRFEDLRKKSAKIIGEMDFAGFGIGGSFDKNDMNTAVRWVNEILPENKPRHLLGIGEPRDIFGGVENGCDTFDCVAPTRQARNGALYTKEGRINIRNAQFADDFTPIEIDCQCYACTNYTKAYIAHLFRADELFANTLASIHNLYFIVGLVENIRKSILDGTFAIYKRNFLASYYK